MNKEYSFETLKVWQKSRSLVKDVYQTTDGFPSTEKFGLTSQMKRATVSVCSNIAEGCTRLSDKDKGRFYTMAFGSLMELLNQLMISEDLQFIDNKTLEKFRIQIDEIGRMLDSLHKSTKG